MAEEKRKKCKHAPCVCLVADDEDFCSEYCENAHEMKITEIACSCEHEGCTPMP